MDVREASASYVGLAELPGDALPVGYKQTEVGMIPEDWMSRALGTFCEISAGGDLVKEDFSAETDHQHPFPIFSNALSNSGLYGYSASSKFGPDCITVTARGDVGHAFYRSEKFCAIGRVLVLSSKQSCDLRFVTECINSLVRFALESTGVPQLTAPQITKYEVPLPPTHAEQKAIAEALSDADALIESLEQLIAKKRQIKQGIMQALLTGKQRLPGFDAEWRSVTLGDLITHCSSGATPYRGRPDYYAGTVKWITSGELNYNVIIETIEHISEEAVRDTNLKMHPPGTFLMAITGLEAAGTRGSCGIVGASATTNQSCMAIYLLPELKTEFLYHYYVLRGNELALQYCQGTKQQSYTAKIVKLLPIDLPPTAEEQTAIATILTDMDAELAALEARLAKTRQLKQGMMQELLTGRIRLVQPASSVVPLPKKKEPQTATAKPHNQQINEAVVIAALTKHFGSEDWPLARVRRTKLAYLLHRHTEGQVVGFLKKAAGPYDPSIRYKGPESIALKKGYVRSRNNGKYEGFVASENIAEAEAYFEKWYGADAMAWLEQFHRRKTEELELLTTVDMAVEDLRREGKLIAVDAVKQLIHDHPEWKPKLDRVAFSDAGIAGALAECQALFAS